MAEGWAQKRLEGPTKAVKRAYLVESDFGKDVFESAKGAARFIIHNLGGSYIAHINFGRQRDREFIRNVHKKIHKTTDSGSAVDIGGDTVRDPQFLGMLAKEIRTKDEVTIQSGSNVPVNTLTWKGEVKLDERSVNFRVSPVDYFKGRQFPSYVDDARVRQNLKEDEEEREEMEYRDEERNAGDESSYLDEEVVSTELVMFDYQDLGAQYYINTYNLDYFEDNGDTIDIAGKRKDIDRMIRNERVESLEGGTY